MKQRTYIAIDLKSFYASVECVERGLDPLEANLVVADVSRTEKTICLAVSPSLKSYGIPGRARLFEVVQKVKQINQERRRENYGRAFRGSSVHDRELKNDPYLSLDYVAAVPRMAYYMEYSSRIYSIYLKYIAPEDIHVYSIDEVFMDVTGYLKTYGMSAHELAMTMIRDVLKTTGITATAGIGTNLYLAKVAMDIVAKHIPADKDGVRIAELDEMSYRRLLWEHTPLTDFWRVGRGIARRLNEAGLYTMGDVARCSLGKPEDPFNEETLYKLLGINAELLIDHAWGWEPCTIADIKAYKPASSSIGSGQVLFRPYTFDEAALVVREMVDQLSLDLTDKGLVTDRIVLGVGYDRSGLEDYSGPVSDSWYGIKVPKSGGGTAVLKRMTSSSTLMIRGVMEVYENTVSRTLPIRRLYVTAANVLPEAEAHKKIKVEQYDLFTDSSQAEAEDGELEEIQQKDRQVQQAILEIRKKFGKNSVLKGRDLDKAATQKDRNAQIGGHKA